LFSFGRADALNRGAIERLVASLARLLDPAAAAALTCPDGLAVTGSRPLGGTFILDALWRRLLLIRIAENTSGWTWQQIRTEASRVHAVTFTGPAGTFRQVTELTKPQRDLFTALAIDPPKRIQDLTATP
jgi:hypothetical protein